MEAKKHQVEAESSVLGKIQDTLYPRNIDIEERDEKDILIYNTIADQYTVTRGAWHIDLSLSRYVARNNYLDKITSLNINLFLHALQLKDQT